MRFISYVQKDMAGFTMSYLTQTPGISSCVFQCVDPCTLTVFSVYELARAQLSTHLVPAAEQHYVSRNTQNVITTTLRRPWTEQSYRISFRCFLFHSWLHGYFTISCFSQTSTINRSLTICLCNNTVGDKVSWLGLLSM